MVIYTSFIRTVFLSIIMVSLLTSCATAPKGAFGHDIPAAPDYSKEGNWAALPWRKDSADAVPLKEWNDVQDKAAVDIFFIHPTTYTGHPGEKDWNGSLDDEKLNVRTDKFPIRYQATVFNSVGKIYAPRYRQAHFDCFFTKKTADAAKALALAYDDVSASFQYYLDHYNQGRPFIIASHSQGTWHAKQLIAEYIDGQPLQQQFVAGYLVGLTVPADLYKTITPCEKPDDTGCICSWRTFRENHIPKKLHFADTNIVVTNPVTWDKSKPSSDQQEQLGAVLRDFYSVYPHLVHTSIYEDLLWINRPKFPWSFLLTTKNYHIADYNFFYADIRQNALLRVNAYFAH
jgi:hypothetical protein